MGSILRLEGVRKHYAVGRGTLIALDDVSLAVEDGETVGIVGESGCGKSTLARIACGLEAPTGGSVSLGGVDPNQASASERQRLTRLCQMVFQDPYGSMNPRMKVGKIVGEPLAIHGVGTRAEQKKRVEHLLRQVGLSKDAVGRYPHAFSGGQRQRIAIARALALRPRLLVADEPVSALDVSVQAQVLNLLADLRESLGLTLVVVSHDLSVIRWLAQRVVVMYLGRIVEDGPCEQVLTEPAHPYTRALLDSAPRLPSAADARARDDAPVVLEGEVPSAVDPPSGCHFHPRCALRRSGCELHRPVLQKGALSHRVACHDVHGFDTSMPGDVGDASNPI